MRAALLALLVTGCAGKDVDEIAIACTTDDECPDETWCDVPDDQCRSFDDSSPPQLELEGVVIGNAPPATSISVPSGKYTSGTLLVRNTGGSQARTEVKLVGPDCLHAGIASNALRTVDVGERAEGHVAFDPDPGCASPARVIVEVIASGRPFAFAFDVTILP
jgi:hypothetical protein